VKPASAQVPHQTQPARQGQPVPIDDLPAEPSPQPARLGGGPGSWLLRLLIGALVTTTCAAGAWFLLGQPAFGIDDADIAQVYGKHLAEGHGLVYTPGFERVEGYSSTTWMLVWALAHSISARPTLVVSVVSFLLCAWSIACLLAIAESLKISGRRARPLLALLLTLPAYFTWNTLTLMDLGLWSALIVSYLLLVTRDLIREPGPRRAWPLALVLTGLALTRPEGLLLAPFALVLSVHARAARGLGLKASLHQHAWPAATLLIAMGSLFAFRMAYFGYPLPNTYYAKVSPDRLYNLVGGLRYVLSSVESMPWIVVLLPLCLGALCAGLSRRKSADAALRIASIAAAIALLGFGLPLFEGGDHFGAHRLLQPFLLPALIPAIYLAGRVLEALPTDTRKHWSAAIPSSAVLLVLVATLTATWAGFRGTSGLTREFVIAAHGRNVGTALTQGLAKDARPSVGAVTAGGIALTYEGRVLDLMGLNWTDMGHSPGPRYGARNHAAFDTLVFWQAPPEVLLPRFQHRRPSSESAVAYDFDRIVLADLFKSPRFDEEYEPRMLPAAGGYLLAYVRRDWDSPFEPLP
jgi:arabinofuranosyltransferase